MASSLGFMAINDTEIKPELPNHNELLQDKLSTKKAQELISHLHTRSNEEDETELNMSSFEELEKKSNFPENNDMFKGRHIQSRRLVYVIISLVVSDLQLFDFSSISCKIPVKITSPL